MATLKACLAVVNDFTAEDFAALEAKARDYAGDKSLTNSHFIKAAQDTIATLKDDIKAIESGVEQEAAAPAPATRPINVDMTANAPAAPQERKQMAERRLKKLVDRKDVTIGLSDEADIELAIEKGDYDMAMRLIVEIEDAIRNRRYRTTEDQSGSFDPIDDAELREVVAQVEASLGGGTNITILDDVRDLFPQEKFNRAGVLYNGEVYLFRRGIESGVAGLKTIFHELFHKGLRNLLPGAEYNKMMRKLYNQSALIRDMTDAWMKTEVGLEAKAAMDKVFGQDTPQSKEEFLIRAVDEVLAEMAEKRKLPGMVRQLGNWLADVADRLGMKKLGDYIRNLGMNPLEVFVNDALRASVQGRPAVFSTQFATAAGAFNIEAKPGANVVRMAKLLGPKLYGTPEDLQKVSVKEIFQNSFDAIKALIDKGELQKGAITIKTDKTDRTITVVDNGSGMSPTVLANQFLQIAGTFKETTRSSGGLGIAKMLFLFANESLDVITARDGKVARLSTSGEELMASLDGTGAAPQVSVEDFSDSYKTWFPEGHGTIIKVKVPEKYTDPSSNEEKDIPFREYASFEVLDNSPLFSNIDVSLNGDKMDIGAKFPADKFTQFANINFEWGAARIYVTKDTERVYGKNAHILSNGLWQFSAKLTTKPTDAWADPIQRMFYVDVSPKVKAEDAGYPFDLNRQQFSKAAKDDFEKIFNYITLLYRADSLNTEAQTFGTVQYMDRKDGRVVLTSPKELKPDVPQDGPVAAINPGDTVEVREGSLIVNGRKVPELTRKDLEKAQIDVGALKIDQSDIDPNRVMIHDNLEVEVPNTELIQAQAELRRLEVEIKAAEKEYNRLQVEAGNAEEQADVQDNVDYVELYRLQNLRVEARDKFYELGKKRYELEDKVEELRYNSNTNTMPIVEAARVEFGSRFNEYVFGIGDTLRQLRDLVADVMNYPDLKNEGMGISFDKEYRGVSIRIPFAGMFINPAVPEFLDPARAAYGMFGTMVHEFAHHKVRSHNADFPAEMQRILIQLDSQDKVDIAKLKRNLVEHVKKYEDVLKWLNERNTDDNSKPRGRRFKDGNEQSRFGDDAGDMGRPGQGAERQQRLPGQPVQGGRPGEAGANRAAGRAGGEDGQALDPNIRFRTAPAAMQAMAGQMAVNNLGRARRGLLSATFLRDLESRFKDKLAGVADYVKATFDMSATAADIQEKAKEVDDAINALPDAQRKELMEFMADATSGGVVVEETPERNNNHLSRMVKNAAGDSVRVFDPIVKEMQDKFAKLSEKQKTAYRQARDALAANWKKRGELLERTANDIYKPLIEEAQRQGNEDRVRELRRQRNGFIEDTNARLGQISGDYFPMMRFGEWVVVRKSSAYETLEQQVDDAYDALEKLYQKYETHTPEQRKAIAEINKELKAKGAEVIGEYTEEEASEIKAARDKYNALQASLESMKPKEEDYYVAQFESEGEARAHAKEVGGTASLKRENARELSPISRTMLSKLEESLAASMKSRGNVTALVDAKRAMYQVFLQTLPERSALMRQAKRKNIAGFDRDMQRSIASVMLKDSFYLSRMEHGDRITEALNEAYKDAQAKKSIELQEVHNELARRLAVSLRYVDTPIQDAIAGLTYIWQLGVSPGYLIANMVQPFTVSLPMMTARHGAKSATAFAKAWGDTARVVLRSLKGNVRGEVDFKNAGLPTDEVEMLDQMLRNRLLNVTLVADLARTADGQPTSKFASMIAKPSHFVEVVNRMSSALAAYRLEKAKTGKEAATKYAQRVLADTHFDYSAENAPYFMKPGAFPMTKVAFQFKKYQAGMISLFVKAAAAMASGSKVEKREAMAQVTGMLATHFAIGGALGLPAVGTLLFIANLVARAFGDDEEPWDAEVALRNTLSDSFGPEAGRVLAKGLPTLLGADLSQKAGVGDLLNPVPTLRSDKQGRDFALEILATLAGPFFGGVLPGWFDAASNFARGDFVKGVEKSVPKWVADPIRAGRFLAEGVTTKQGTVALDREAISAWDAALQASGLPSATITESYEARAAIEAQKKGLNDRVGRYKKDWLEAKNDGDDAAARAIWDEIRTKVNPARVRNGLPAITMGDLLRFRQERRKLEGKYAQTGGNTNPQMGQIARFAQ